MNQIKGPAFFSALADELQYPFVMLMVTPLKIVGG